MKKIIAMILGIPMLLMPTLSVNAVQNNAIKVLSIGHSYSVNSCEYLYDIAKSQGVEMTIGIAYRGNCSLRDHYEYLKGDVLYGTATGDGYYKKYVPGGHFAEYANEYTLKEMLLNEKWDYIIFQDCLDTAGNKEEVSKWLSKLYEEVKSIMQEQQNIDVQYIYHQIWAMENTEYNPEAKEKVEFANYNYDSDVMYQAVSETSKQIAKDFSFRLLPTGESFELARKMPAFDVSQGGEILVADSTNHANEWGKYLAGITWFETITQKKVDKETIYYPELMSESEAQTLIDCATQAVVETGLKLTEAGEEPEIVLDVVEDEEEETKGTLSIPVIVGGVILAIAILVIFIVSGKCIMTKRQ